MRLSLIHIYQTENKLDDGYFTLDGELDDNIRKDIEELDVSVYDNLYVNLVSEKAVSYTHLLKEV